MAVGTYFVGRLLAGLRVEEEVGLENVSYRHQGRNEADRVTSLTHILWSKPLQLAR